jgi:hypothetical protein
MGFSTAGVYYDFKTSASFVAPVVVTIPYNPSTVTDPSVLRLYHYDETIASWVDITTTVDVVAHTVSGVTSSFSTFAAGVPNRLFSGFLPPISRDGNSTFKVNSTIPVKFKLRDASGVPISSAVAKIFISGAGEHVTNAESISLSNNAPDAGNTFRYDGVSGQYIFNLTTKDLSAGRWLIRVLLDDGISFEVFISLR